MSKHQKYYWTWIDGEVAAMKLPHPRPQEKRIVEQMKYEFLGSPDYICWFCGGRQDWWTMKDLNGDHVAPFIYYSPLVITCKNCNSRRRSVLHSPDQIRRLFHVDNVVRDRSKEELKNWCQTTAKQIFGDLSNSVNILLAKTGNQAIRMRQGQNAPVCLHSERMCKKFGFILPEF